MADGNVIHFNKDDYNRLMQIVTTDIEDIDKRFLRPAPGLRLDDTLGDHVKPGAPKWGPVDKVKKAAGAFGGSAYTQLTKLSDDWDEFVDALKGAVDVFQTNADLATMSAQEFLDKYPDFHPGGS